MTGPAGDRPLDRSAQAAAPHADLPGRPQPDAPLLPPSAVPSDALPEAPSASPSASPSAALSASPPDAQPGPGSDPQQSGWPQAPAEAGSGYAPPTRSRGTIALLEEDCTVCMLCARECPSWCISIEAHDETGPPLNPGGRPRSRHVLDRFAIDFSLCMYCGICIEVCPFDALFWAPTADYPASLEGALVHEREQLRAWLADVPAPPEPDAP